MTEEQVPIFFFSAGILAIAVGAVALWLGHPIGMTHFGTGLIVWPLAKWWDVWNRRRDKVAN